MDRRIRWLRTKNLKWCNSWYQEQLVYRSDYRRWWRQWFAVNKSRMRLDDVRRDMLASKEKAEVFSEWGLCFAGREFFPIWEGALPLEDFTLICEFHWHLAPAPAEK